MGSIVDFFGNQVQKTCRSHPQRALRLLRLGYHAKHLTMKYLPDQTASKAAQFAASATMQAMRMPLDHPEKGVMVSLFTPCEMLHAMELYPYFCEGFGCFLSASRAEGDFLQYAHQQGLPETFCSYHKIFIGAAEKGLMPKPRFIINTTLACDANLLTFRRLSQYFHVPQFVLDIPYHKDKDAVSYVARQLRELKDFLEKNTGKKLDPDLLWAHVQRSRKTLEDFDRFMSQKKDRFIPSDLTDELYSAFLLHPLLGSPQALRYAALCLEQVQNAPPSTGIRLLWMHTTPFWVKPLREIFFHHPQVEIAACDMSFESINRLPFSDDPYEAMAMRLVYSAFNGPFSHRIQRSLAAARQTGAEGVVYFCHWGCKHTLGGAQLAKKAFQEAGLPCLLLDGDGCDQSFGGEGQQATRMEAFLEMLRKKKGEPLT